MVKKTNIDWKFIESLEGYSLKGYVPQHKDGSVVGQSGVTILAGFDLGQHSYEDLERLDIPELLILKLNPYLGLRGQRAVKYLKEHPLALTHDEAQAIERVQRTEFVSNLDAKYFRDSATNLHSLTTAQQTVLCSVAYQYGLNLNKRCPTFWRHYITKQWNSVIHELRNFGDAYSTRRNKEADLLQLEIRN